MGTVVYFDPEFKALSQWLLTTSCPTYRSSTSSIRVHDGRKLLIHAGSDRDPGRYYVFDRDKKALTQRIMEIDPSSTGGTIASVKAVTIPASDGASIPAYLTFPPGRTARNLPAICCLMAARRSRLTGLRLARRSFLQRQGYAVLQPEYRGSAG